MKEDKSKADGVRQKALERYSETKKHKSTESGDEWDEKGEVLAPNCNLNLCKRRPRLNENYVNKS